MTGSVRLRGITITPYQYALLLAALGEYEEANRSQVGTVRLLRAKIEEAKR